MSHGSTAAMSLQWKLINEGNDSGFLVFSFTVNTPTVSEHSFSFINMARRYPFVRAWIKILLLQFSTRAFVANC